MSNETIDEFRYVKRRYDLRTHGKPTSTAVDTPEETATDDDNAGSHSRWEGNHAEMARRLQTLGWHKTLANVVKKKTRAGSLCPFKSQSILTGGTSCDAKPNSKPGNQRVNNHLILCPVDYSESTEMAISLAVDLAKANNSKVVLLHVIESDKKALSINESIDNRFQERLRKQYLEVFGINYRLETRHGDPATATIEYARQIGADLIVMGTKGRTGLANLVVGSVARRVMAGASCPVVTVKTPASFVAGLSRGIVSAPRIAQSDRSSSGVRSSSVARF